MKIKMSILALTALFSATLLADASSSCYVQDGLVAHWDGIDNTLSGGVRSHNASATTWSDVTGHGNDVTIPTTFVTVEDSSLLSVANTSKAAGTPSAGTYNYPTLNSLKTGISSLATLGTATNSGPFTIEVVTQRVKWRYTDNCSQLQNAFNTPRGTVGYRRNEIKGFYYYGPESTTKNHLMNWYPNANAADVHTLTATFGVSRATSALYLDNTASTIEWNDGYSDNWNSVFRFFSNLRADIRVYAIRVYARALSKYERARNLALDHQRFGGVKEFVVKRVFDCVMPESGVAQPDVLVLDPETETALTLGTDYTLTCENNDRFGSGTYTITGLGSWANCTKTGTFQISPAEAYKQTQYIASTGKQFIDTGYLPNTKTVLEIDWQFVEDKADRSLPSHLRGSSPFGCGEDDGKIAFSMNFGGSASQDNTLYPWFVKTYGAGGEIKEFDITKAQRTSKQTFRYDAATGIATYAGVNHNALKKTTTHTKNTLHLFGTFGAGGSVVPFSYYTLRVYGCRIWDGATLKRDFIPVYRVFDFKVGLLDRVSGVFYTNEGEGDFSRDLDSTVVQAVPEGYTAVNEVVATGGQYIATGVIPDTNTTAMAEITLDSLTAQRRLFASRTVAKEAMTADDLFFEAYLNDARNWACLCADGPISDSLYVDSTYGVGRMARYAVALDAYGSAFYVNGSKRSAIAFTRTKKAPSELRLLAADEATPRGFGRLHGAWIWQSGVLVRHLVPCVRDADKAAGLYDTVGGGFYPATSPDPVYAGRWAQFGVPQFAGSGDGEGIVSLSSFFDLTNFSFTAWVKDVSVGNHGVSGDHYGAIVAQGALGNMPGFCCFLASNDATPEVQTLIVQTRNKTNAMCSVRIPYSRYTHDGKWHHIAFTHDLGIGEEKLYFDGQVVASTNAPAMVNPSIRDLTWFSIGARRANEPNTGLEYPVQGRVAEVTLWKRALSADEVDRYTRKFATDSSKEKESGLIGHWPLAGGKPTLRDTIKDQNVYTFGPVSFVSDSIEFIKRGLYLMLK